MRRLIETSDGRCVQGKGKASTQFAKLYLLTIPYSCRVLHSTIHYNNSFEDFQK